MSFYFIQPPSSIKEKASLNHLIQKPDGSAARSPSSREPPESCRTIALSTSYKTACSACIDPMITIPQLNISCESQRTSWMDSRLTHAGPRFISGSKIQVQVDLGHDNQSLGEGPSSLQARVFDLMVDPRGIQSISVALHS
jgi:hypothetical protein